MRPALSLPDVYYKREKIVLTKKEQDAFLVCLALGPNRNHPYIETADFKLDKNFNIPKVMNIEEVFDYVLKLHESGGAYCLEADTWGNYSNPEMEIGCQTHFIRYSSGNAPTWFRSGLEHGIPEEAFKTDISFIANDLRSAEEITKREIEGYNQQIEMHNKEIEKLQKKISRAYRGTPTTVGKGG